MTMRMISLVAVLCYTLLLQGQRAAPASALSPHVDQRVVLMSVLYHLAAENTPAAAAESPCLLPVDKYFLPYAHHPAVLRVKKLLATRQFDLQEMMILALALTEPPQITLRVLAAPDDRWTEEILTQFLPQLRDFYRDSKFEQFYSSSAPLYQAASARFSALLEKNNINWFVQFYGGRPGMALHILLVPYNGPNNFEFRMMREDKSLHIYSLVGNSTCDTGGTPIYPNDNDLLNGVLRNVNNSYIVPLVDDDWNKLQPASERLFKSEAVSFQMQGIADSKIMIQESLARAVSILADRQSGGSPKESRHRIFQQQGNGFVWMDKLVDLLNYYQTNRIAFADFKAFQPNLASFYRGLAPQIDAMKADFAAHSVHVIKVEPFANGATDVSPAVNSLTVTFDKPLDTGKNFSFGSINDPEIQFPIGGQPIYADNGTRLLIPLALLPGQHYAFELSSDSFSTSDGYPLETYRIEFKTK